MAVKRLILGVVLILFASSVLLISDWQHRVAPAKPIPHVALFQFASRPILDEAARGLVDGLSERGYVQDKTILIQKYNSENDLPTANNIAKAIIDSDAKMVLTLTTPCLQAMASVNRDGKLIHVFGTVTDPFASGVGLNRNNSLNRPKHLVGIGTFQPVKESFNLAWKFFPHLKIVGNIRCPAEACSLECTKLAREVCREMGIELLEVTVDNSVDVLEAARSLVSRGAQALWVGGDNVVELALSSVIKAAREAKIPVFTNAPGTVAMGVLFGLGADYYEVGKAQGFLAADVLDGRDPASIPINNVIPKKLTINLDVLRSLRDPWHIPDDVMKSAAEVVGCQPHLKPINKASSRPVSRKLFGHNYKICFLNYTESTFVEDAVEGIHEEFDALGFVEGRDYTLRISNAQGDMPTLMTMIDGAVSEKIDLIMVSSTPALQAVACRVHDRPVVFGNIASPILAGVATSDAQHQANLTGVSTLSDFDGMARLVRECLPHARRAGTLFVPSELNSVFNRDLLTVALKNVGIELKSVSVSSSSDVLDAAISLTEQDVDALCQVNSSILDASFSAIAQAAQTSKTPLFAFTSGLVERSGGAVGLSRDYIQGGRDMVMLVVRILNGEDPAHIPIEIISTTILVVNLKNADLCGLRVPDSVLKRADRVIER